MFKWRKAAQCSDQSVTGGTGAAQDMINMFNNWLGRRGDLLLPLSSLIYEEILSLVQVLTLVRLNNIDLLLVAEGQGSLTRYLEVNCSNTKIMTCLTKLVSHQF